MGNPYLIKFGQIDNGKKGVFSVANTTQIPFEVRRIFWIFEGEDNRIAGEHAHKKLEQVLVALEGIIKISTENSAGVIKEFILNERHAGLYIPSNCWHKITFSDHAALLSFSSREYDSSDYIRDYNEFKNE